MPFDLIVKTGKKFMGKDKTNIRFLRKLRISLLITILLIGVNEAFAQIDTNRFVRDTTPGVVNLRDTSKSKTPETIKDPINYQSDDSMMISLKDQKVYLYGKGNIKTGEMELNSEFIEIGMQQNYVYAEGRTDSTGKEIGKPVFKEGNEKFDAKTIKYNFKTKKGIVRNVITEQSGGFVHGTTTKMHPNKEVHIADGKYTTCDAEHPHFYIELTKAKVIPGKKIISGPLYFVLADIPIYFLGLPFGYFPSQTKNTSGIILPQYGEEKLRGFFLRDAGYYWAISDNMDFTIMGSVYSKGTLSMRTNTRFMKRYRYTGSFDFQFSRNVTGEEGTKDYTLGKSYLFQLNYMQDPKAHPTRTISANITYDKGSHTRYNAVSLNDYVQNNTQSSVSYQKRFNGTPFNLSANMRASQRTTDSTITMSFPNATFNMNRVFPFKRKNPTGKSRWYEKVGVAFSSSFNNQFTTKDSLLFTKEPWEKSQWSAQYSVPIGTSFNLLRYFNVSPSVNYNGRIHQNYINKELQIGFDNGVVKQDIIVDTIKDIRHSYDFYFSVPLSTNLYGMFEFKRSRLKAIRHVISPSVSYNYRPDFSNPEWGFYLPDPQYDKRRYSIYERSASGTPPQGKQGSIGLNLSNKLEIKIREKNDTAETYKKIPILENFYMSTSYNMAADSLNWSDISMNGNTRLFEKININFGGSLDPYTVDTSGIKINKFEWNENKRLARLTNFRVGIGATFDNNFFKKKDEKESKNKEKKTEKPKGDYEYFTVPWSLSFDYSVVYSSLFDKKIKGFKSEFSQTLNGSLSLTPTKNWRFSVNSGWDFKTQQLTSTSISIFRDLHCWEMSMTAVPFGRLQSYMFRINIKSSIFKGVEYKKDKSPRDNPDFF